MRNHVGERYDRIVVLSRAEDYVTPTGKHYSQWLCKCDCGNTTLVLGDNLKRTHSCGCKSVEAAAAVGKMNYRHGGAANGKKERLYRIWDGIKKRCYNPKTDSFPRYGGRGITMCEEWENDYAVFKDWALSHGYRDDLSIDRIDSDGDYCPDNCRWATNKEQQNNLSSNRWIDLHGQKLTVAQFSERYGVPHYLILHRLNSGFSADQLVAFAENYNNKEAAAG